MSLRSSVLNPERFRDWAGDVRVVEKGEKIGF